MHSLPCYLGWFGFGGKTGVATSPGRSGEGGDLSLERAQSVAVRRVINTRHVDCVCFSIHWRENRRLCTPDMELLEQEGSFSFRFDFEAV